MFEGGEITKLKTVTLSKSFKTMWPLFSLEEEG